MFNVKISKSAWYWLNWICLIVSFVFLWVGILLRHRSEVMIWKIGRDVVLCLCVFVRIRMICFCWIIACNNKNYRLYSIVQRRTSLSLTVVSFSLILRPSRYLLFVSIRSVSNRVHFEIACDNRKKTLLLGTFYFNARIARPTAYCSVKRLQLWRKWFTIMTLFAKLSDLFLSFLFWYSVVEE